MTVAPPGENVWVEVSRSALAHNTRRFLSILSEGGSLGAVVKANAYGHGIVEAARIFLDAGAHWLCVNALYEAEQLRSAGIDAPIYVMGYVSPEDAGIAVRLRCRVVVYRPDVVRALDAAARGAGADPVPIHIKVETGNNRQGLSPVDARELAQLIHGLRGVTLEGLTSHYADIEDTTDHSYARCQLARFREVARDLAAEIGPIPVLHFSNSAAAMLWPETHFDMIRPGISLYGMWPSKETYVSALVHGLNPLELRPALTWKTRIAQIKEIGTGDSVGYGRSFRATHPMRLAVLPLGYYDGYDRGLSNRSVVLIGGDAAPVRGRVCMNMTMVDVTHVRDAAPDQEVVVLGAGAERAASAERLAELSGTINYEVTTRINERLPRRVVD
ncbi:MAG: alanine racemase [Pseudomonadota bacterium]